MEQTLICPVCGFEPAEFFTQKNNFTIYQCANCGLGFVWPLPGDLEQLYDQEYFKKNVADGFGYIDYYLDKEAMKDTFSRALEEIGKLIAGRRLFDVGAATGYFLDLARERGWQTAGAEISEYAASIARSKGHKIFLGPLIASEIKEAVDTVTMWDVLEHLDKPGTYLKKINQLLSRGGLLVINTINKGSWWSKLMGSRWHALIPPEHLYYYSVKSLAWLMTQHGFEILTVKRIGKKFSLPYIFKTLGNWQKIGVWFRLAGYFDRPFWRSLAVPINLRDNIFLIARKK